MSATQTEMFDSPDREFTPEEIADAVRAFRADDVMPIPGLYETQEDCALAGQRFLEIVRTAARVIN